MYTCTHVHPCLGAWSVCLYVDSWAFWLGCSNLADRPLSNVDYFEVQSFDLLRWSMLCSEQANATLLRGQLLSLLMLLLYSCSVLSALSLLFCFSYPFLCTLIPFVLPPFLQLPLSLFLTHIMTWTMSWQHKEPSDFISTLAPLCHRQCGKHVRVVWFNKTGCHHCWLTEVQNMGVFYGHIAHSWPDFLVNFSFKKCPPKWKFENDSPHLWVISALLL